MVGATLLILAIFNGFLGYSLPDDLVSGTGIRIAFSILESVPLVGSYLAFFLFGGAYPGHGDHPALFHHPRADHPARDLRAPRRPPRHARAPQAHAVPRPCGRARTTSSARRCGPGSSPRRPASCSSSPESRRCSVPSSRSTRSGSTARTSRTTSATPSSRTGTWAGSTGRSVSCRAGRSTSPGHMIPNAFFPAVLLPGITFTLIYMLADASRRS